jgi:diacylglycerol O-acyltransferase / wax synthase
MASQDLNGADWGGPADMSAWEALMWRAEADPRTRSTGVLLEILDGEPDWDRLVAAHDRVSQQIPRLRERAVEPLLPLFPPAWSPDPHFDLGYHLQRVRLPKPGTMRQLLDLAQGILARPLDKARPPWEAVLIEGLEDGRAGYLLKVHHSLSDGIGLIQLLTLAHSRAPEPADHQFVPPPAPRSPLTPASLLANRLRQRLLDVPSELIRRGEDSLKLMGRTVRNPGGIAADTLRFGRSLRRVLTPPPTERSRLLRGGGGVGYRFVLHDVPLSDLKAAGKAAGGSVNDAFLAGLLGAFRRYHEHHGVPVDLMPIGIPVSLRTSDDPAGGNRFAGARFAAPVGEPDPRTRIEIIREFVVTARAEPAIGFLDLVSPTLSRLPTAAVIELAAGMTNVSDFQASNIPGMGHPVYLAGARVTGVYPLGPRPGVAAMIAMISYDGTCCIGLNVDPDVISDLEIFETCLREGFDEVLALRKER